MTVEDIYTIKYGGGKPVYNLLKTLDSVIASEKSKLKSTDVTPPYMHLWQEWVGARKIFENVTKAKLQRIILNRARAKRHEQPQETMKLILDEIKQNIPPFNNHFQYKDDPKQGAYIVSFNNPGKKDKQPMEEEHKNEHSKDIEEGNEEWVEPKTYASATKATIVPEDDEPKKSQTNRYEILTNVESEVTSSKNDQEEKPTTVDDSDLSNSKDKKVQVVEIDSDLSFSTTSKEKEGYSETTVKVKSDDKNSTITPQLTPKDDTNRSTSMSPAQQKTKPTTTDDSTLQVMENDDGIEDSEYWKAKEAEILVKKAIADGTVDTLEVDTLARWIDTKSNEIETITKTLNHHGSEIITNITTTSNNLHNRMKMSLSEYIKDKVDSKITTINNTVKDICNNLDQESNKIKSQLQKVKFDSKSMIEDGNKRLKKVMNDIEKSESNSIININTCANRNLNNINESIKKSEKIITSVNNSNTIALGASNDVKSAITKLHDELTNGIEKFQDDITEHIDIERDNFDQWIASKTSIIEDTKTIMAELSRERAILRAEREIMKKEQELMIRDRIAMKQWFDGIKEDSENIIYNDNNYHNPQPTQSNRTSPPPTSSAYRNDSPIALDDPIPPRTVVKYKSGPYHVQGYITDMAPYYCDGEYHYSIHTNMGNEITGCKAQYITVIHHKQQHGQHDNDIDQQSSFAQHSPYQSNESSFQPPKPKQYYDYKSRHSGPENHYHSNNNAPRPLSEKEFIYPVGTPPKTIYALALEKSAKDWNLKIKDNNDIRAFYERLRGKLAQFNILLKAYDNITKHTGIEEINTVNCTNYENARKYMSSTIFNYFDQYKTSIFENYREPIAYIDGFRRKLDGLGFLKNIMKKRHPNLREIKDETKTEKPKFTSEYTIFTFVNAYLEWLHDEKLRNKREYTQKEQLDHIMSELDNTFDDAKSSIRKDIKELNLDGLHPKPFPDNLTVNEELPLYIISLLSSEQQEEIYNDAAAKLIEGEGTSSGATINVAKTTFKNNYRNNKKQSFTKNNNNQAKDKWAEKIEWKIIPGATCEACNKANHNVYETGCPQLATFAICKDFHDKTDPEKLRPVIQAYKKYRKDLNSKLKQRRNNDRKTIRTLAAAYDEDDISNIKQTLYNSYLEDFKDEQYCMSNPYNTIEDEAMDYDDLENEQE